LARTSMESGRRGSRLPMQPWSDPSACVIVTNVAPACANAAVSGTCTSGPPRACAIQARARRRSVVPKSSEGSGCMSALREEAECAVADDAVARAGRVAGAPQIEQRRVQMLVARDDEEAVHRRRAARLRRIDDRAKLEDALRGVLIDAARDRVREVMRK